MSAPARLRRRGVLAAAAACLVGACSKRDATPRCELCGMKIDPASPWRAELATADGARRMFDTPRCAITARLRGTVPGGALRVQEFYDRTWVDAASVRFAIGADVIGPMGPDLVPVDARRADKFVKDHHAERALELEAITQPVLDALQ